MGGYERNTTATVVVFAFDQATSKGKTGDAANLTIYYKKKGGSVTVLTDTTFVELDATNAPGYYEVDLGVSEIDAQYTHFFPKSSTAAIGVVVAPPYFTVPVNTYLGTNETVVGTNNDKTGYSISGTKTTLDDLADITTAQVNTEVVDALVTDVAGEPGTAAPPVSASIQDKIAYLYKFMRNRVTATSTTITVYNDDTTTAGQVSTHSDDATTYDRGEFGSG